MLKRFGCLLALCLIAAAPTWAEVEAIGYVKTVKGEAFVIGTGSRKAAEAGTPVYLNDVLSTGETGSLGVTFKDNSRISIGPDTELSVDTYIYAPRENKLGFVTKMSRGTLNFVSGTIAKLAPDSVAVETPAGTIGVRGTHFLVKVEED